MQFFRTFSLTTDQARSYAWIVSERTERPESIPSREARRPKTFWAHTRTDETGNLSPEAEWEPLFTPFAAEIAPTDPETACSGHRGAPCEHCERMEERHGHLNKVAWWTGQFAAEMFPPGSEQAQAARQWGWLAGLWHDLGKFAPEWQEYLKSKSDPHLAEINETIDHSTAGAQHAVAKGTPLAHFLAYAISGHHSGLLDAISAHGSLEKRLKKEIRRFDEAPAEVLDHSIPPLPKSLSNPALFTRMLFSCLVDADFLATEAFMSPGQSKLRPGRDTQASSRMQSMREMLEQTVAGFGEPDTSVNFARARVFRDCQEAATKGPGLFSLTVPTGGGKTLSSLAFALRHAIRHGQTRVIYVIPFTSIIEQNASVFEEVFAPLTEREAGPIILQHHSNLSPARETERSRLAAENWDAPLIVTTAVQFYESLFADRTSKCRKLHRVANSVVILDEAQCLPVDYLKPCLDSLRDLTSTYHTSVVLCTATQPTVHRTDKFPIGLENVREIVSNPRALYQALKRVEVVDRGNMSDDNLASEMAVRDQVLTIVNTRKHAQNLYRILPEDDGNRHLSALMCPAHRRRVLDEVRKRLADGDPVRLVSTQLIEAGVDVDFPVVYRSLAGLDSIAQAAGRCNRNGKREIGEAFVFRSEHQRAEAYFRETAQIAERVLALHGDDLLGLESVECFFALYYYGHRPPQGKPWDTKLISDDFRLTNDRPLPARFQFREAAHKFRLIENDQVPVLIPFDDTAKALLEDLRNDSVPLNRLLLRGLQPYVVQIYRPEFLKNRVQFESVRKDQFHLLICPETHYSDEFGLNLGDPNDGLLICE